MWNGQRIDFKQGKTISLCCFSLDGCLALLWVSGDTVVAEGLRFLFFQNVRVSAGLLSCCTRVVLASFLNARNNTLHHLAVLSLWSLPQIISQDSFTHTRTLTYALDTHSPYTHCEFIIVNITLPRPPHCIAVHKGMCTIAGRQCSVEGSRSRDD